MLSVLLRDDKHLRAHPDRSSIPFLIPGLGPPTAPKNVLTGSCLSTFYLTEMAPTPPWVLEPREPSPGFCSWGLGLFWLYCALSLLWFHPLIIPTSFSLHPLQYLGREQSDGSLPQKYPDIFLIWAAYFCVIGEVKLQMGRGVLPTRLQKVLGAAEKAENLWLFF